jgi:dipeptidase E
LHGSNYLDHCQSNIQEFFQDKQDILFVPFARPSGKTYDEYTAIAKKKFEEMGFKLSGIHEHTYQKIAAASAEAIFIGGGNTFVLLKELYESGLIEIIRRKVGEGTPYLGTSAGSNVAGKTIMTTNDMPISYPPSFEAMGLVPFIINPHYLDPDPNSKHMGETRETRIKEYHIFNNDIVVGLREGAMLRVIGNTVTLLGTTGARIFRQGQDATEHQPGETLDFLLL